jgi:hypothetical protein
VGRGFGFPTSLWLVNRLGTTLQHLFNARVTKIAGFLRPTSPWLYGRIPRCPAEALHKEFLKKDLVRTLKDQSAAASMVPEKRAAISPLICQEFVNGAAASHHQSRLSHVDDSLALPMICRASSW